MATTSSRSIGAGLGTTSQRRLLRRQQTIEEALNHALAIMAEHGVGALTISEVARRMGLRGPSLYKYFPGLHAVYDALFARGVAANAAAVSVAIEPHPRGTERIRAAVQATVRWCIENPALAQLLYWRPVPGFTPTPDSFAASTETMAQAQAEFAEAVRLRQLAPTADSDEGVRLLTVVMSGLITQQMANEPGVAYRAGRFSGLTDQMIDMFFAHFQTGDPDADPRQR
ncbi:MAG: TetR/AcrR family transcriptional regulator [Nocardioidaceae bacterium]|jgi:AcrR family transcriptional regulator|nr:TetR/AcrR family transcriptional regulator [Nocardioidaceae bacterium]